MVYQVNIESISININDKVRNTILKRLETYDFPYVTSVENKNALRNVFKQYFEEKKSFLWLKGQISHIATKSRGIVPTAMTESNRLHTGGLGDLLLSKGITKCVTVHSYGLEGMSSRCKKNIDGKTLDIKEIIKNSFPDSISDLNKDIPMIPQHVNCRHVMAPLEKDEKVITS